MALDQLTPEVWTGRLLRALETSLVYAAEGVVNRDYEGEITAFGDSVHIPSIGDPTVSNYVKNTDMAAVETLSDADSVLQIDQAKSVNFAIDDIDGKQNKPSVMEEAVSRAGYGLRRAADSFMSAKYTEISATNVIGSDGSPITGTWAAAGTLAYDRLVDLGVLLDNTDTPEEGRFAIVPPWFEAYLRKDARFVGYGTPVQDARLTNGVVGEAAGFQIRKSNTVPNTSATKYKIIAGHSIAWSFASQILQAETYRPERRFASAYKALFVFGGKIVRPDKLALLTGNPT